MRNHCPSPYYGIICWFVGIDLIRTSYLVNPYSFFDLPIIKVLYGNGSLKLPSMVLGSLGVGLVVEPLLISHFPLFFLTLVVCDWPCHNSKCKVK
jgi:hypothetical protein